MKLSENPLLSSPENAVRFKILHALTRPLDELAVKDICANAGVSRDTFYRYFTSKYDIAVWHGRLVQSLYLEQVGRTIDWETGYFHNFRLLAEEKEFYGHALKNLGRNIGEFPEMEAHRKEVLLNVLKEKRGIGASDELVFCVEAYTMLETVLVVRWLRDGCVPDPKTFTARMLAVLPRKLYDALAL